MARLETIRLILAHTAQAEVYVAQPEGFFIKIEDYIVFKLSKALYGLRQALRAWNILLNKSLKSLNFMKCSQEQSMYTRNNGVETFIVGM